ncbi:MAG: hypothetical protein M3P91_03710, partial [Actinomycetota bacterium]|nr:hypothetical protein [Actinomycetota bacterium]
MSPDRTHDQPDLAGVRLSPAKTVNGVSAMSAPETSGVESQFGIDCQPSSGIASIAARTRLSCRAVVEKRTSNFAAVVTTSPTW